MASHDGAQRLLRLLEEITNEDSAAAVIRRKLHAKPTVERTGGDVQGLMDAMVARGLIRRNPSPFDACTMEIRRALVEYVGTHGRAFHPILPRWFTMDALSASYCSSFIASTETVDLRWAMCRICLDLHHQWWWLGTTLTPTQYWDIAREAWQHMAIRWNCSAQHQRLLNRCAVWVYGTPQRSVVTTLCWAWLINASYFDHFFLPPVAACRVPVWWVNGGGLVVSVKWYDGARILPAGLV